MRPIQLLPSIIALFIRLELPCKLPPNRADRLAVFEEALFGTIALPSSTATPLALFGAYE